jgi:hypothetical protein
MDAAHKWVLSIRRRADKMRSELYHFLAKYEKDPEDGLIVMTIDSIEDNLHDLRTAINRLIRSQEEIETQRSKTKKMLRELGFIK